MDSPVEPDLSGPKMYRSSCPALSLVYKIGAEGDTDVWHYDGNDGVVSLLLQKPDDGGLFEYAPYIRSEEDENYDAVARLFADPETYGVRPAVEPGPFVLFNGKLSMHRVTPVGNTRLPRIIALSNYAFNPAYVDHVRRFPTDANRELATAGWPITERLESELTHAVPRQFVQASSLTRAPMRDVRSYPKSGHSRGQR